MSQHDKDSELDDYLLFIQKIKTATGIDLAQYKEAQMKRRLTTLRAKHGYDTFAAFFEGMNQNKTLFLEFLDRMTINVSEFWRNRNRWEVLQHKLLPDLYDHLPLKVWSAACSTGEEPYTLAMILDMAGLLPRSKIMATDIDEGALAKAMQGTYLERSLREVPEEAVKTYFKPDGLQYKIDAKLRDAVHFSKQNLLHDSFEDGFDLIVCRNVMIYFTEEAKHMLYQKFAKALRPGGILFVGSTEQIFSPSQYDLEGADTFFYRKKLEE
ncbi:protein-glutamate O-methyltransferase CheR [Paenibacillus sp. Marseille-Q4541]|uniref:CheR family methyltransferase n=1 Tax=Paenibacillus sp. Marseille-Q4541 TaxID=2831522 RepID=UPI0024B4A4F7|nr:protein-glutamate O-methyltransferase CheR [Paenibacillus sp. Marseille-Q4541]